MEWLKNLQTNIQESNGTISEMQLIFYNCAQEIMNNYYLQIENLQIELTEIEFYYFDCTKHEDVYVHSDDLQKHSSNYLYVHKQGWTRGGIDITFGNGAYYGGILIRGIKHNNLFISGSATVKNYIASKIDNNITTYQKLQSYFDTNKKEIGLINRDNVDKLIYHSPRIIPSEQHVQFLKALYRFAREDYLYASNNNLFPSYQNLKDRTKLKVISNQTLGHKLRENISATYKDDTILQSHIQSFKNLYNNV